MNRLRRFSKSVLLGVLLVPLIGTLLSLTVGLFIKGLPHSPKILGGNSIFNFLGGAFGAASGLLIMLFSAFLVVGPAAFVYSVFMSWFGSRFSKNNVFHFVVVGALLGAVTSTYMIWSMDFGAWKRGWAIACVTGALCGVVFSRLWRNDFVEG